MRPALPVAASVGAGLALLATAAIGLADIDDNLQLAAAKQRAPMVQVIDRDCPKEHRSSQF